MCVPFVRLQRYNNEVHSSGFRPVQFMDIQKTLFERIVEDLREKNVAFVVTEHEPVKTSEEAARIRGVSLSTGAKAIVLYADKHPIMVVVPGDKRIDIKEFKKLYGIKDLRMATPEEVKAVTSVSIGAVPPFGTLMGISLYMDSSLRREETIFFNPGLHEKTIALKEAEYERATVPTVGEFSKE